MHHKNIVLTPRGGGMNMFYSILATTVVHLVTWLPREKLRIKPSAAWFFCLVLHITRMDRVG